ncbi:MAG: hypothetical protein COU33_04180, partial [Candidatus Magasanikbacteria bacterium CG10_big_fil_rev_8_21_14_0_10_43_6]
IYILVHGFLLKKYSKKQKVNSQLQQSDYTGFIPLFGIIFLLPILFLESFDRYFLPIFVVSAIILVQIVSLKTDPQKSQQNGTPG